MAGSAEPAASAVSAMRTSNYGTSPSRYTCSGGLVRVHDLLEQSGLLPGLVQQVREEVPDAVLLAPGARLGVHGADVTGLRNVHDLSGHGGLLRDGLRGGRSTLGGPGLQGRRAGEVRHVEVG